MSLSSTTLDNRISEHLTHCPSENRRQFLALALAGEVGELANLEKKQWRDGVANQTQRIDEAIDCANYLLMYFAHHGLEVGDVLAAVEHRLIDVESRPSYQKNKRPE